MKSFIKGEQESEELLFEKGDLYRGKDGRGEVIILVSEYEPSKSTFSGQVIWTKNGSEKGSHYHSWDKANFKLFKGEITLVQ